MKASRRTFLHAGAVTTVGLTLSDYLRQAHAEPAKTTSGDSVLFINLGGGPAHLDTLDMKQNLSDETKSEFGQIQTKIPGLVACEHLPKIAEIVDQCTLIRGISHTTGDHPQGQNYISTGNRPGPALKYPSYGSIIMNELKGDPDLPPYVAIPGTEWNAGYMGDAYSPFKTNAVPKFGKPFAVRGITLAQGVTVQKVNRRNQLLNDLNTTFRDVDTNSQLVEALDTFGKRAHSMITSERTQKAFDVSLEPESIRNLFGKDDLGQSLLLATRLIDSGSRFVTVTNQGWDTHTDNFKGHARLMPPFDAGFAATLAALRDKGLLERTLVIAMGEFGRTPKINQNRGRDHYPRANWCLLAGGGVRPNQLIGGTDDTGTGPDDDTNIKPDDLGASILHSLGIDHHKEYYTKSGRPVGLVPHGTVIPGLFV